jgi:integral membrane sensor domain MASE1
VTGVLGHLVGGFRGDISPWWPPAGIAVVALLVFGPRVAVGVLLGAFCTTLLTVGVPLAAAATAFGDTLAALCAYLLLRRVGFRLELDRLDDVLALLFAGAFTSMLVSATIGVGIRVAFGVIPVEDFLPAWLTWWSGDVMGVLVVAPFLLSLHTFRWRTGRIIWRRWIEAAALLIATVVITFAATWTFGALYVGLVFVGWAAWRYQVAGAAPCALLVSVVAIVTATRGHDPFAIDDLFARIVSLQLFNGVAVLGGLLLAVAIIERNGARRQVEEAVTRLNEVLGHFDEKSSNEPARRTRR